MARTAAFRSETLPSIFMRLTLSLARIFVLKVPVEAGSRFQCRRASATTQNSGPPQELGDPDRSRYAARTGTAPNATASAEGPDRDRALRARAFARRRGDATAARGARVAGALAVGARRS